MRVREREPGDEAGVRAFLEARGSLRVARLGRLEAPLAHPALLAEEDGRLLGVLTYVPESHEVLTLHASERGRGVGTALIEAAAERLRRLWLITTNDNLDALRFYQRRGFRLVSLRPGAVDAARRLKPSIPPAGAFGIPLRDELDLERQI